jgi:oligopeptide/dipeptide ABC transporter ATP-binding protein
MGLEHAFPDIRHPRRGLVSIAGAPPRLDAPPPGCAFAPRCPFAEARCRTETPAFRTVAGAHAVACHLAEDAPRLRARARDATLWQRLEAG